MQNLQWVVSGYVLTYGGFLLLGGRAADLARPAADPRRRTRPVRARVARRRPCARPTGLLVAARLAQGVGAALMSPAALSILTTTFTNRRDRNMALGAWAAVPGLAGASGVVLGGVLTARARLALDLLRQRAGRDRRSARRAPAAASAREPSDGRRPAQLRRPRRRARHRRNAAAHLHARPRARRSAGARRGRSAGSPAQRRSSPRFVANERRAPQPAASRFSIFRIKGLAAADVTQLITFAGFYSMFFFLSLYMQNVLGYSPSTPASPTCRSPAAS